MTTPTTTEPAKDEENLADFVHHWAQAIVSNDVAQMAPFTTDDWILIDKPGVVTRDAFHDVVASGLLRHDTMTHDVLGIQRLGPVAIVRTHGRNTGVFDGSAIEADEWTTNILVRTDSGWQCMLTQLTPRVVL